DDDETPAAFPVASAFDQQGNDQQRIGTGGGRTTLVADAADARVQYLFQAQSRFRLGEGELAHGGPVEGAGRRKYGVAEGVGNRRHGRPAGGGQLVRHGIGVDDDDAVGAKALGGGRLAAADAAREADDVAAHA